MESLLTSLQKRLVRDLLLSPVNKGVTEVKPFYTQEEEMFARDCLARFCKLARAPVYSLNLSQFEMKPHAYIKDLWGVKCFLDRGRFCEACIKIYNMIFWFPKPWVIGAAAKIIEPYTRKNPMGR